MANNIRAEIIALGEKSGDRFKRLIKELDEYLPEDIIGALWHRRRYGKRKLDDVVSIVKEEM